MDVVDDTTLMTLMVFGRIRKDLKDKPDAGSHGTENEKKLITLTKNLQALRRSIFT